MDIPYLHLHLVYATLDAFKPSFKNLTCLPFTKIIACISHLVCLYRLFFFYIRNIEEAFSLLNLNIIVIMMAKC